MCLTPAAAIQASSLVSISVKAAGFQSRGQADNACYYHLQELLPLDPFGAGMGVRVPDIAPSPCRTSPSPAVFVALGVSATRPAVCRAHSRVDLHPNLPTTSATANPFQNWEVPHCIEKNQNYQSLLDEIQ